MRLHNTLTRGVEEIVPIEDGHVRMYTCGPTVYRYAHLGNLRTFMLADLIRFEAARAWGWYDRGLQLLPLLDRRSAACCAAMAGIYHELLRRFKRL